MENRTAPERELVPEWIREPVLRPYRPSCRYLLRAFREGLSDEKTSSQRYFAEFRIPESCYIDSTGHFNSVEFNICFNQIFYLGLAESIVSQRFEALRGLSFQQYLARQLPDVLIHEFHSHFKSPITLPDFRAVYDLVSVSRRERFTLIKNEIEFRDARGGYSHGQVTCVLLDRSTEPRAGEGPA